MDYIQRMLFLEKRVKKLEKEYCCLATDTGGGAVAPVSKTYTELTAMIAGSTLTVGQTYLISDFQTVHYIFDGAGNQVLDTIITGTAEPLIVKAIAVNELAPEAYSPSHPYDLIHYDWNSANWLFDNSFADLTDSNNPVIVPGFKGVITFRHDTLQDNSTNYDFRNVKFRRWRFNVDVYAAGTTYAKNTFVRYNNNLYRSLSAGNVGNTPASGSAYWNVIGPFTGTEYLHTGDGGFMIPKDSANHADLLTFNPAGGTYENGVAGVHIQNTPDNYNDWFSVGSLLPNNVFHVTNSGLSINSVIIKGSSYGNTFFGNMNSNVLGEFFSSNFTIGQFIGNTIGVGATKNIFGITFSNNQLGATCVGNCFGSLATYNTIGNHFQSNTVCGQFQQNTIQESVQSNQFGDSFQGNVLGSNANANIFKDHSFQNVIGSSFVNNTTLQANFKYNNIPDNFSIVNMTSATHAYATYNKTYMRRADGTWRLMYINNSDVATIVAANA